ncbi:hypothetical protein Ahy_A09g041684 [Arachis hypogaea]|uniref:Aminotransferase-like plant mobile domain-containing protein n=1 Tax=Arachis hypogaea TaxID=3818 RepID=A0A445BDN1_ARAHY|nr:hypothetical protein Ahy_A09g041684 [Arachis hypogaea]
MSKRSQTRKIDRPELHIVKYLNYSDYDLRMLTCDHLVPPDWYNERVEEHLRSTVVQCQKALVNALVERWHPDTHTFYLLVGECVVTLEDVAMIFSLPTDGLPVTEMTLSNGVSASIWGRTVKVGVLRKWHKTYMATRFKRTDTVYVKCHIMLLIVLYAGGTRTPDVTGKCYNLRIDPPRRSASQYTPSSENFGAYMASKSKTRMKDGSSNGTSFTSAFATSITFGATLPSP